MKHTEGKGNSVEKVAFYSAMANWLGDILLYPLDTISTRLKARKINNTGTFPFIYESLIRDKGKLYKGASLSFGASFVPIAIYVYIYEVLTHKTTKFIDQHSLSANYKLIIPFFISGFAELICLVPYLPVDTLRKRIQAQPKQYANKSLLQGFKSIIQEEGVLRFYKSTKLFFTSKVLFTGIQFQSFQLIRHWMGPSWQWMIVNTIFSSVMACVLLNPLEVLVTRYALFDTTKKQLVLRNMVQKIYKNEGFSGFYKGLITESMVHSLYSLFWMPLYQILRENEKKKDKEMY